MLTTDEIDTLRRSLARARIEHRELDLTIAALAQNPAVDQLQLRRLKKRKLQLKDTIVRLVSRLIPDLDA